MGWLRYPLLVVGAGRTLLKMFLVEEQKIKGAHDGGAGGTSMCGVWKCGVGTEGNEDCFTMGEGWLWTNACRQVRRWLPTESIQQALTVG